MKKIYFLLVCFRFYWMLQPQYGYIHPDEFFQGPEKIAGDVFNYDVHTAWEFDSEFPVRSTFLWYMICGYTFSFLRILRLTGSIYSLDSYWLLVAPRVMMTLISLLTDTAIMRVTDELGCSPYLAGCISATSYVTLVFYTRTFSNSLESFFLAILLVAVVEYVHLCRKAKLTVAIENRKQKNNFKNQEAETNDDSNNTDGVNNLSNGAADTSTEESQPHSEHQTEEPSSSSVSTDETKSEAVYSNGESDNRFDRVELTVLGTEGSTIRTKMGELMERHVMAANKIPNNEFEREKYLETNHQSRNKVNLVISCVIVAGIWNRPTFLGFALVPGLYWIFQGGMPLSVRDVFMAFVRCLFNVPYVVNAGLILILFDTSYYRAKTSFSDFHLFDQFVVTPLNFLVYNQNSENLAEHGIHPRYMHALINSPLLFGPLVAFGIVAVYLAYNIRNKERKVLLLVIFFSIIVPLLLLSVFPHQEARFIIPLLVPYVIIAAYVLHFIDSKLLYVLFGFFWISHNIFLGFLFGSMHQGGVVPSLLYLQRMKADGILHGGVDIIYHRTYMPPKHLLQLHPHEAKLIKLFDMRGTVTDNDLEKELSQYDNFIFVTPYRESQLNDLIGDRFSIKRQISIYPHLSMEDPPDLDRLLVYKTDGMPDWDKTLEAFHTYLTLNIYSITNRKLIIQTIPQSGDYHNHRRNIEHGAYEVLAITLPRVKSLVR